MNDVQLTLTLKSILKNHEDFLEWRLTELDLDTELECDLDLETKSDILLLRLCVFLGECFLECLLLDGDLDLEEDLCVLGDLDLQDPIPPCDVLKCL